jgi:sortase (surface protein transpeptidase)
MTELTIKFINAETGEETMRKMNAEELTQYETDQAVFTAKEQAKAEQSTARTALLARLGITAEEATLLLS